MKKAVVKITPVAAAVAAAVAQLKNASASPIDTVFASGIVAAPLSPSRRLSPFSSFASNTPLTNHDTSAQLPQNSASPSLVFIEKDAGQMIMSHPPSPHFSTHQVKF